MAEFVKLDNVSTGDIFSNVNLKYFQFLHQNHESLVSELPAFRDDIQETQPMVTIASLMPSQIAGTETLQVELSHKVQQQHSVPDENVPLPTPLGLEESRFSVVLCEEITELKKSQLQAKTQSEPRKRG